VFLVIPLPEINLESRLVLASTVWIAIWWISEAIPIAATSLLPIFIFPTLGILSVKETTTTYFSPIVVLYLGGFIVALAIEKWNLHQRIALTIISKIGTNSEKIILGFMIATGLLSMWISNTATALMMLPIGLAIASKMKDFYTDFSEIKRFEKALMLAIAYSASIGGMATLIGTPTNAIFSAVVGEIYNKSISFDEWFLFGLPFNVVLMTIAWYYLTKVAFKIIVKGSSKARNEIRDQLKDLGKISSSEKRVLTIFVLVAVCWIIRSFVLQKFIPGINDTSIAIFASLLLFVIPAGNKKGFLMDWKTAEKLPWGILLLFGAGITIASAFQSSGLAEWFGNRLTTLEFLPLWIMLLIIILLVNFFTEITSNVATASVLLPILGALAISLQVHPFGLMVGACMAASCAFMLPVATPPNAIVFSSGALSIQQMVKAGLWLNFISSLLLFLFIYFVMPYLWNLDLSSYPLNW
jgi:sodium-dependent dicarboxylate transporter 2/3/5